MCSQTHGPARKGVPAVSTATAGINRTAHNMAETINIIKQDSSDLLPVRKPDLLNFLQ